jgi:hypothetical protein
LRVSILGLIAGLAMCATGRSFGRRRFELQDSQARGQQRPLAQERRGLPGPVVTYSLVSDSVDFPGARNCRKMTSLDELTASSQVAMAAMREEISAAFAMWESVAGISFREATDPAKADILIGAQVEPEGWAFADVFYDARSPDEIKPISRSLVCLNPTKRWKVGFDGDLKIYDLRYTLTHEIGHAIGLDHPSGAARSWAIATRSASATCSRATSREPWSSMVPAHRPSLRPTIRCRRVLPVPALLVRSLALLELPSHKHVFP